MTGDDDLFSLLQETVSMAYDQADAIAAKVLAAAQPGIPAPESQLVGYRAAIESAHKTCREAGRTVANADRYTRGEPLDIDGNPNIFF